MKNIFAYCVATLLLWAVASSAATTLTVTNTDDSGLGSLRQAILDANADASPDPVFIEFNIPGAGVQTIAPLTALPIITRPVKIDGYTQPGSSTNSLAEGDDAVLLIQLTGTNNTSQTCIYLGAGSDGSVIRGLVINGFDSEPGILANSSSNVIAGNFIGTDANGGTNLANYDGVDFSYCSFNTVGGTAPADRNVISGNSYHGIYFYGLCASNVVQGNFIGTDRNGTNAIPNVNGVVIYAEVANVIGGTSPAERNIISGNSSYAIQVESPENVVQGNYIGTDVSGRRAVANYAGIAIVGDAPGCLIGGSVPGAGNLISSNLADAIVIDTSSNIVQGNLIGVDVTGTNAMGNGGFGVTVGVASSGNLIGGAASAARNVIANDQHGIGIYGGTNNVIQGNYIGTDVTGSKNFGNSGYGIYCDSAPDTLIGGTTPGAGNLISGNGYDGIYINSPDGIIQGNLIGTDVTGTNAMFNNYDAITLGSFSTFTQIGGTNVAARNVLSGNGGIGIYSSSNNIQGNYLGIGSDGQTIVGAPGFGITIDPTSEGNLVGGDVAGAGNLISGWYDGIRIAGSNNVVQGNFIGTDAVGTLARGNYYTAVTIWGQNNLIGGLTPGARNLISASDFGLVLSGNAAAGNIIQGNFIGTDVTGMNALTNYLGIDIESAPGNLIGGTAPEARNVISGSSGYAIGIGYDGASNNIVQGNYLGLAADGITPLPNASGLRIFNGANGSLIGGIITGSGNSIAHNTAYGISLIGEGVTNNAILGNSIFSNGSVGIDLAEDGVTANDTGDADDGQNHLQNFPVITSSKLVSGDLNVTYQVDSAPENSAYPLTVEFFLADANGQGQTLIHRDTYNTPQASANITFTPSAALNDGDSIVATATDANGNSSEFSAVANASVNHSPVVANPVPDQGGLYGSTFDYTVAPDAFSDPDAGDALSYSASGLPPGVSFDGPTRTFSGTPTSAGVFSVTLTATDDGAPPLSTNDMFDIVVAKAGLVVTANNKSKQPGDPNPPLDGTLVGVTNNDPISVMFTTTADTGSPAGDYPITPVFDDPANRLSNYAVTTNVGTLTVAQSNSPPVVANPIPNMNSTYGAVFSFTFDANTFTDPDAGQLLSYVAGNLPPGITFNGPTRTFSGTNTEVGAYQVTVTATDNGSPPLNTNAMFQFVVGKASLLAQALDQTNTYPNVYLDNYYGVNYSGFVLGQNIYYLNYYTLPVLTSDATNGSPAGVYPTTLSGGSDPHYEFICQGATLTVAPASLLVQSDDICRQIGHTNPPLTGTLSGVFSNDNISMSFSTTATEASPLGDYPIIPGLLDPDGKLVNYTVTSVTGLLHVVNFGVNYDLVRSFGFPDLLGTAPEAALVQGSDGALYGTASIGVYRISQDGSGYQMILNFNSVSNTAYRSLGLTEGSDGVLYGTTFNGGSAGFGTVFRVNRDGTGYSALHSFAGGDADTDSPEEILQATNGVLYGLTLGGFGGGKPALFRVDTNGSNYAVLREFDAANSVQPACLLQSRDGKLYGTTTSWSVSPTVFRLELDGSGFTTVYTFASGVQPKLIEASDDVFYGADPYGGSVFRLNRDGSGYSDVHIFAAADGTYPFDTVIEGPDGALYGTTAYNGPNFDGTVFRLTKDGTSYTVLHSCGYGDGGPRSLMKRLTAGSAGQLHGVSVYQGANGEGCLFKLDTNGANYQVTWSFSPSGGDGYDPGEFGLDGANGLLEASDGRLYGVTAQGGSSDLGTVFSMNMDGSGYQLLHQFSGTNGEGTAPIAGLVEGKDHALYGSTSTDPINYAGAIFKISMDGSEFQVLHTFGGSLNNDGASPQGSLVQDTNGVLYGVTGYGGANCGGTVFSVTTNGVLTILRHLTYSEGANPVALTAASDGAFYVTAQNGSTNNAGAILKINTDGTDFTVLHAFFSDPADGWSPQGRLLERGDGWIYGVTGGGGISNVGTIYRIGTNGSDYVVVRSLGLGAHDAATPYGGLQEGLDGALYGVSIKGGLFGAGAAYRLDPATLDYCVIHSFGPNGSDGLSPACELFAASNGYLFGTASGGGSLGLNLGAVFRVGITGNQPPQLVNSIPDQMGNYGQPFSFAFDADTFSDPDAGQVLSYAVSNLPPGIAFDGASHTFSGMPTNVGTFSVTVTATDNGTPPLSTNDTFDIVVAKASLVVTANNKTKLVGDPNPPLEGTLVGVTNNDPISVTFTTTADTGSPPGDYPITPVFDDPANRLPNYAVTTNAGTLTVGEPNNPPVVANPVPNTNSTYGDIFNFTFAADTFTDPDTGQTLTYTASNLPPGVTFEASTRTFGGTNTGVGIYPVTVTATDNGAPPLSTNTVFEIDVAKALLTVQAHNVTNSYGGYISLNPYFDADYAGFKFAGESVFSLQTLPAIQTTATSTSSIGTYPIHLSGGSDSHYAFDLHDGVMTLVPAPLTIVVYNVSRLVDQANPPLSGRFVGLLNNDPITLSFSTTATPSSPAGSYPIYVAFNDPGNRLPNYSTNYLQGELTVLPYEFLFSIVHEFGSTNELGVVDVGSNPGAAVTEGVDGLLYGITVGGGTYGHGAIFRVNKNGTGYTVLHPIFVSNNNGLSTPGPLIQGTNGSLFGAAAGNGTLTPGIVFSADTNGNNIDVLKYFSESVGTAPNGPLQLSTNGLLYGTTSNGKDTIYRIQQDGTGYTLLWSNSVFGTLPWQIECGLIEGSDGWLYGSSVGGGDYYAGTVFRIQKDGSDMTVLHSFTDAGVSSRLTEGTDGWLYGVSATGGMFYHGSVFRMAKDGSGFTVLHNFDPDGGDGSVPIGSLLEGNDGYLYGSTREGGAYGGNYGGTVYRLKTDGTGYSILHNLGPTGNNPWYSTSALIQASDGLFYGTTEVGGLKGYGVVFQLAPLIPPTLKLTQAGPNTANISWFPQTPGFHLQENATLDPATWTDSLTGVTNPAVLPINPSAHFFRLNRP